MITVNNRTEMDYKVSPRLRECHLLALSGHSRGKFTQPRAHILANLCTVVVVVVVPEGKFVVYDERPTTCAFSLSHHHRQTPHLHRWHYLLYRYVQNIEG